MESKRKGDTGIGHTLEVYFGLLETNHPDPDFGDVELKAHREDVDTMITLFTLDRNAWQIPAERAIELYGSTDFKGRKAMYYTLGLQPNNQGLFIEVADDTLLVKHSDDNIILQWLLSDIVARFMKKVKKTLLVTAKTKTENKREYFHYNKAVVLSGGTSVSKIKKHLKDEVMLVDLRLHKKGQGARNHGTGFRVKVKNLVYLFEDADEIDL